MDLTEKLTKTDIDQFQTEENGSPEGDGPAVYEKLRQAEETAESLRREKEDLEKELGRCRLEYAAERALTQAGARNARLLLKIIGTQGLVLGEDDSIEGLHEKAEALKASDPYLFGDQKPYFKGYVPEQAGDFSPDGRMDFSDMTYSEVVELMNG